ncbi:hypothetical protein ZOSMA_182G00530 [Zostera marina]|uniref:Uncharacterized protein n=1 Tax=Zostera marina TaxID=29655 RepID=A0A0K9PSZ0_ZOSMR|nr:hypothetical protein ZOSMA_182G00530 [Zostera marina]
MEIPNGVVVGLEKENVHVLVQISGIYDPKRIHSSCLERVSYGLVTGDWVRMNVDDEKQSSLGSYTNLQMTSFFSIDQFVRLKKTCNNIVSKPRFDWQFQIQGSVSRSTTSRISWILPNRCLVVNFPGRFVVCEAIDFLADPAEVEQVSFSTCEGFVKKFQHLEDFHWLVKPLWIALGYLQH